MNGVCVVEPHVVEGVGTAPTRDTARLAWGVIGGIAPDWTSGTSRRMVMVGLCRGWCFSCSTDKNLSRMRLRFRDKSPREFYGQWRLMKVMDLETLRDIQGMSVAPRCNGSGTTAIQWFSDFRAWERDWMYGSTDAMRRAVLLSLIPASRSNPLKEMVNQYQIWYQDLLREVTEEVFTEANEDVILEAFHTVKPSSLTPTPRELINFVDYFLALGRRVRDEITKRRAKNRLLDVIATMKVDGLLKEIIKEETKVGLEFNYLDMIIFVMNPRMSCHKLAIRKGHIMREDPKGHQDQEQADPELSIAEIQEICDAQVLAMSGRAGAAASSIPKCPACGKGRQSHEGCWVLRPHKAPEWLQEELKSKRTGEGGQAKPAAQGGGKGKGPHKGGQFPPCKGCGRALHPPEDCWTLDPEVRQKAKAEGRLGKRHN